MSRKWIPIGLLGGACLFSGCAGTHYPLSHLAVRTPIAADDAIPARQAAVTAAHEAEPPLNPTLHLKRNLASISPALQSGQDKSVLKPSTIKTVNHEADVIPVNESKLNSQVLNINGKKYRLQPEKNIIQVQGNENPELIPVPVDGTPEDVVNLHSQSEIYPLDLGTSLALIGGQHPTIGFAQWKVQEAYARLDEAEVMWLPTLQAGFGFHRHDGNYQASNGGIVDVNRSSFQYGLGNNATGAGTTPRPGIVAQFHMTDAVFQPRIEEKNAWAQGHAANSVYQKQLLTVALSYLDLLEAEQDVKILEQTQLRTTDLVKITADFATTGQGLRSDADRMQTEQALVANRISAAKERADIAASALAQALSLDTGQRIVPVDPAVVPIEMVASNYDRATLIATGLTQRPELKEAQALVAAAYETYQRERYRPFIPSVLLGLSTTGFGGGVGTNISNVDGRYDLDAAMTWEIRNLGLGEQSRRQQEAARMQQANYEKIRILDQVTKEITDAYTQISHRNQRIQLTQQAIETAQNSFELNLSRIREGQGLPIEVLQTIHALEEAQRAYLNAVVDYNEAQFRLQWALGWPLLENGA